jgi:hypothetical protein
LSEFYRTRLRAFVPNGEEEHGPRRAEHPRPEDRALLLHVHADDRERVTLATTWELVGYTAIDELLYADAGRLARLRDYAKDKRPDVPVGIVSDLGVKPLQRLGPFVSRRHYRARSTLIAWDLPCTLGRIAAHIGRKRGSSDGFSLSLVGCGAVNDEGGYRDAWFHPRYAVTSSGTGQLGAFIGTGIPRDEASRYSGRERLRSVDLQVFASALAGDVISSPQEACELFGVSWLAKDLGDPDRLRAEATALVELYRVLVEELHDVAPGLPPDRVWSTGSLATWALKRAKLGSPSSKTTEIDLYYLGESAAGFGGGRIEARMPGIATGVGLADVSKMYPTMLSTLGLSPFYRAESFGVEDVDTEQVRQLLVSRSWRVDRNTWGELGPLFVTIRPHGETLPIHVEWTPTFEGFTVAPLDLMGGERSFHACDLAAAVEEGADPEAIDIVRAWRLVAEGKQPGSRRIRLLSGRRVDPLKEDLGAALVEECAWATEQHDHQWLPGLAKRYAQGMAFGNLARCDRRSLDHDVEQIAYGPDGVRLAVTTKHPEMPGPDAFLPLAACVTAGARLVLAMAHRFVRDLGSEVAACNTDSIVVPVDKAGSEFECPGASDGKLCHLTPSELDAVLHSFDPLGIHWRVEVSPTTGLVVGTNKVIFGHKRPDGIWKPERSSDTGIGGHIADPSDTPGRMLPDGRWAWASELEGHLLAYAASCEGADLSQPLCAPGDLPSWAHNRPALRRFQATSWSALKRLRRVVGDPTIGPYASYFRAEVGGDGPAPVALGAGYDPATWIDLDWRVDGEPVGLEVVTLDGELVFVGGDRSADRVVVRSIADHFARWLWENDPSTQGPDRGLRQVVPVRSTQGAIRVVGRHGDALLADFEDPETPGSQLDQLDYGTLLDVEELRRRTRRAGLREVERRSRVPEQSICKWLRGANSSEALVVAVTMALAEIESEPVRCALSGCERPVPKRARWCCPSHRRLGSRIKLGLVGHGQRTSWAKEIDRERAWQEAHDR